MARHQEAREVLLRTALTEAWRRLRLSLPPPAEASAAQEDHWQVSICPYGQFEGQGVAGTGCCPAPDL